MECTGIFQPEALDMSNLQIKYLYLAEKEGFGHVPRPRRGGLRHRRRLSNPSRDPSSRIALLHQTKNAPRGAFSYWRRRRDSNPRYRFKPICSLSRGVPSTTRPLLQIQGVAVMSSFYSVPSGTPGSAKRGFALHGSPACSARSNAARNPAQAHSATSPNSSCCTLSCFYSVPLVTPRSAKKVA